MATNENFKPVHGGKTVSPGDEMIGDRGTRCVCVDVGEDGIGFHAIGEDRVSFQATKAQPSCQHLGRLFHHHTTRDPIMEYARCEDCRRVIHVSNRFIEYRQQYEEKIKAEIERKIKVQKDAMPSPWSWLIVNGLSPD